MCKKIRLLAGLLLIIPFLASAQNGIILHDSISSRSVLAEEKALFVDSTANLTRWQLTDKLFTDEVVSSNEDMSAAYWYKFTIENKSKTNSWIIEFRDPHVSEVELYKGKDLLYPSTGSTRNFDTKDYKHKNHTFGLNLPLNEQTTFYVRLKSGYHSDLSFLIKSHKEFSEYALVEYYILGLFYGVLAILAIYNLILYFSIKEKTYLFYVAYIFCAALHTFSEDGLGFQFIWPDYPIINKIVDHSSFPLLLITFLLYSNSFTELSKRAPKTWKWVIVSTSVYLLGFLYFNFLGAWNAAIFFIYIIPYLVTYYAAIKIYKQGFKPARFFVMGFSIVLLSFVVFFLRVFLSLPGNIFTVYIFNFGFVLEAIILSYALGDKIRITKEISETAQEKVIEELEKNEKLKDKVNRELETKVKERTVELEEKTNELIDANDELASLRDKLYEMNSSLDKSNWMLQREVKEVMRSKILSESVAYPDFIKIFPDNLTCLRHLESIKWGKGFSCTKCGNNHFLKTTKPFVRKCSSCKHPESVTAHTLFHAVKFPMNKAFYIAYVTCENQKKFTIDELSEILDLRRNTAWMFKKKVEARIDELSIKGKYKTGESWEKLIV